MGSPSPLAASSMMSDSHASFESLAVSLSTVEASPEATMPNPYAICTEYDSSKPVQTGSDTVKLHCRSLSLSGRGWSVISIHCQNHPRNLHRARLKSRFKLDRTQSRSIGVARCVSRSSLPKPYTQSGQSRFPEVAHWLPWSSPPKLHTQCAPSMTSTQVQAGSPRVTTYLWLRFQSLLSKLHTLSAPTFIAGSSKIT